ncbi:ABC transporter permease [Arthrobacter mobilis]|uniref:ABC transporter permease n=1 Tax=Arthrobacter mobilis TaxID=2724944 RepID=A0A7X6HAL6_9MICC|nr:ABC transporter permease [Arthrobacter mobilis]NKX53100.1 ABC transporter permease [Arthrobacter mobilis]
MKHSVLTRSLLWVYAGLVAFVLIAPTAVVIPLSFTDKASLNFPPAGWSLRWYENFFQDPAWMSAFGNSVLVAVVVAALATAVGTAASVGLQKWTRRRAAKSLQALLLAPIVVPAIILAIGVYAIFLQAQMLGTFAGFVLAHTVLAVPFVVVSVTAALAGFDQRLATAAASLGANRWTTFLKVTLPGILPGVVSGALFAFVTSFDEVVLSIFIKSPYLETLPVKMYASVTRDTDPTIAAAATMIMLLTTVIIAVGLLSMRRRKNV